MTYLVDANVLTEPTKPAPSSKVIDWLSVNEALGAHGCDSLHASASAHTVLIWDACRIGQDRVFWRQA
jgi:hypothetical protein